MGGVGGSGGGGSVPAMGLLWSQCINTRYGLEDALLTLLDELGKHARKA